MKPIDVVAVKAAVKNDQLYVGVSGEGDIYLSDSKSGESVCIAQKMPFLRAMRDEIFADAIVHGLFEEFDQIEDPVRKRRKLAMRIMEEAAEMYAAADDLEHYAEEAADVTLMTGDVCGYLGIDWNKAVMDKKAFNKTRPWKHQEG